MRVFDEFAQYSADWWRTRGGLPSASGAAKIMTATGRLSKQSTAYIGELLADELGYIEEPEPGTEWMQRGLELEEEARAMFELQTGLDLEVVGLVLADDMTACCSPDALIYDGGEVVAGWEVKCPKPRTHIQYLVENKVPDKYLLQVHFSMVVTGLDVWYFQSYHPELKPLIIKVERDEFTARVQDALETFNKSLDESRKLING